MTILDQLADHARARCRLARQTEPADQLRARALALPAGDFAFERALKRPGLSFICECKRASPSKGLIAPEYPYQRIAAGYEAAGADCISVLTEPKWFLGSNAHLEAIARTVSLPCLRKDFTVDESMLYEARLLGASAVLLIVSLLEPARLAEYLAVCDRLGMSALVETHDPYDRSQQPEPAGLYRGPGQQPPAAGTGAAGGAFRIRKRGTDRRRRGRRPGYGGGRGAGGGGPYAGGGQNRQTGGTAG